MELAQAQGYVPYQRGMSLKPGDKVYRVNRGKSVMLAKIGRQDLSHGVQIVACHIDSPRLDFKPHPLYEDSDFAYGKTHYYGGIRKYQWVAIPLELRGVVVLRDGTVVKVVLGEGSEPKFVITDLLPHLGAEQGKKPLNEAIPGENLNLLMGSRPLGEEGDSDRVKLRVLDMLHEKYGICEDDFTSAELEVVPAFNATDLGLDRSLIGAYGHDDRVCAYAALAALLEEDRAELARLEPALERAKQDLERATRLEEQAKTAEGTRQRLEAERTELTQLQDKAPEMQQREEAFRRSEAALKQVKPLADRADGAAAAEAKANRELQALAPRLEQAQQNEAAALARLEQAKATQPEVEDLKQSLTLLEKQLPLYHQHQEAAKALAALEEQAKTAEADLNDAKQAAETSEQALGQTYRELDELKEVPLQLEQIRNRYKDLTGVKNALANWQAAAEEERTAAENLHTAQQDYQEKQEAFQQAEAHAAGLRRRLDDCRAGLLARDLSEGMPCPVCGAVHHPAPAALPAEPVTEADLQAAEDAREAARGEKDQAMKESGSSSAAYNAAQEHTARQWKLFAEHWQEQALTPPLPSEGPAPEPAQLDKALANALADCKAEGRQLREHDDRRKKLEKLLPDQEESARAEAEKRDTLQTALADLNAQTASAKAKADQLAQGLEWPSEQAALEQQAEWEGRHKALLKEQTAAQTAYDDVQRELNSLTTEKAKKSAVLKEKAAQTQTSARELNEILHKLAFADRAAYEAALCTEEELRSEREALDQHKHDLQTAEAAVATLEKEAASQPQPAAPLPQLEEQRLAADRMVNELNKTNNTVSARQTANQAIADALNRIAKESEQARHKADLLTHLYNTVKGKQAGKVNLSFEAYIQAYYFERVVEAANRRFEAMSEGRYLLRRRDDSVSISGKNALVLDVLDHYTGKLRPVSSLSGGESFKAALCLALGLSDVIQAGSGGVEIDALFVDEGFGTLDEASLDKALEVLLGLAGPGKMVGVISHVPELKDRITRQIVLKKSALGSTARIVQA